MARNPFEKQLNELSAKVTALTMLIEALYVEELAKCADPATVGARITERLFETDAQVRKELGESRYSLQISEAFSSLIDRAVARAVAQRAKRRRG